mgnify:CR=1 FL=1|tara:strand:- start:1085 stop:1234 length:150 start_codon:yes stop_codon:yes gene_type:complete
MDYLEGGKEWLSKKLGISIKEVEEKIIQRNKIKELEKIELDKKNKTNYE